MQQTLHILIVDCERGLALATCYGHRWMLPVLCAPERLRAGPHVLEHVAKQGIPGTFVGQWLGRLSQPPTPASSTVDWLAVVRARDSATRARNRKATARLPGNRVWMPLRALRNLDSWIPYQQWAVRAATATELPSVNGPFGSTTWVDEVREWVGFDRAVPLRASSHEVVLECQTAARRRFFKGLSGDRSTEATVTQRLSSVAPESFPRTLAVEAKPGPAVWWLMDACPGFPLDVDRPNQSVTAVAQKLAAVQSQIAKLTGEAILPLQFIDLPAVADWACHLVAEGCDRVTTPRLSEWIHRACDVTTRPEVPQSLVLPDLDPSNILVDGEEIRFIDLDGAGLAPAPMAVATLGRRLGSIDLNTLYRSYEAAMKWQPDPRNSWRAFELMSFLLECHLGWTSMSIKTALGEIRDLEDFGRNSLRARVTRELTKCQ